MSTDLYVILGHRLSDPQIEGLPALLNEYSRGNGGLFRLPFSHHLSGEIQEQDGRWVWQPDVDPDVDPEWALGELGAGVLVSEGHWAWAWNPDRDGSSGHWFQKNREQRRLRLTSTLSFSLYIGLQSVVLSPNMRWRNLFDPVLQDDLRRYARFLTGFFGGSSAIYVPDDIDPGCEAHSNVTEGWSFDQITNWLHSQMAPAASISTEELIEPTYSHGMKGFQARGYYLDDFADMTSRT